MPNNDTVQLILDVIGQDGLDRLQKSTENYKQLLEELHRRFKAGEIDAEEWIKQSAKMTAEMERQRSVLDQLRGKGGGISGSGFLGASYAAQDFISVLAGGGGLGRALGAVSNNVPQLLGLLGIGGGLAGALNLLFSLMSAGIGIAGKWWDAAGDDKAAEKAKRHVDELRAKIEKTHEAYQKLANAPTDYEKESADSIKAYLSDRGNAEKIRRGLEEGIGEKAGVAAMTPEEREEYGNLNRHMVSDEYIAKEGERAAHLAVANGATPEMVARARAGATGKLREAREDADSRRFAIMREAKRRKAEGLVAGMGEAGPEGSRALYEVLKRMDDDPANFRGGDMARHLRELLPGALRGQDEELEADQESQRDLHERRARRRKEMEDEAKDASDKLDDSNAEWKAGKSERQRKARLRKEVKELEEQFGNVGDEFAQAERNRSPAELKRREHLAHEAQARELVTHAPEVAGDAFGPDAARIASAANPAEVKAMTEKIARNLDDGQAPYAAVLDAFREVAEASARNAEQARRFYGQLQDLRGRAMSRTNSPLDANSY